MLYRLLSTMNGSRFDSRVVSLRDSGALRGSVTALGVPVHSLNIRGSISVPRSVWRLARLIRETEPDVIQGWLPHGNLLSLLAGRLASPEVPVLWNIRHSMESWDYEKPVTKLVVRLGRWASHRPAKIVYNSRRAASEFADFGYCIEKSTVVYNGFDLNVFSPEVSDGDGLRSELSVSADTVLVGLIGRYHPVKNHANFLRAAAALKKQYSNVEFVLCGSGITWANSELRQLIEELRLTSSIHLLGTREDMPCVIRALDIVVSASHGEGFPNAIGEAMACAVPCVATDVSDVNWIVANAGTVVPKNDPTSMARALADLIDCGVRGRQEVGYRGRARIAEHFGLTSIAEQYASLYEQLATGNSYETDPAEIKSVSDYSAGTTSDSIRLSA
jgi:glycosyltransferase involved in cell wall biosynthesis